MKAYEKHPRWHDRRWEDYGALLAGRPDNPDGIDVMFAIYPI
jgi:hypothetical protein